MPVAAAVKVALPPAHAAWLTGWVVIDGAVLTVRVAAELVADPQVSVSTQS